MMGTAVAIPQNIDLRSEIVSNRAHIEIAHYDDLTPQQLAGMRWQAVEAFNTAAGLSPLARRLGMKLITCMDARTRECFPGLNRVAAELGANLRAVKKAKVELRDAGLINWTNPGGPRHLSRYTFNWAKLLRLSTEAKARGDAAVSENMSKRAQCGHTDTMDRGANGGHADTLDNLHSGQVATLEKSHGGDTCTLDQHNGVCMATMDRDGEVTPDVDLPQGGQKNFQGVQIELHGGHLDTSMVAVRTPDITQDITQEDITHQNTPSAPSGVPINGATNAPIYFPQLTSRLVKDDQHLVEVIGRLGFEDQSQAARLLATKGSERALAFIHQQDRTGKAA